MGLVAHPLVQTQPHKWSPQILPIKAVHTMTTCFMSRWSERKKRTSNICDVHSTWDSMLSLFLKRWPKKLVIIFVLWKLVHFFSLSVLSASLLNSLSKIFSESYIFFFCLLYGLHALNNQSYQWLTDSLTFCRQTVPRLLRTDNISGIFAQT